MIVVTFVFSLRSVTLVMNHDINHDTGTRGAGVRQSGLQVCGVELQSLAMAGNRM